MASLEVRLTKRVADVHGLGRFQRVRLYFAMRKLVRLSSSDLRVSYEKVLGRV